jgi:hypothetical protein
VPQNKRVVPSQAVAFHRSQFRREGNFFAAHALRSYACNFLLTQVFSETRHLPKYRVHQSNFSVMRLCPIKSLQMRWCRISPESGYTIVRQQSSHELVVRPVNYRIPVLELRPWKIGICPQNTRQYEVFLFPTLLSSSWFGILGIQPVVILPVSGCRRPCVIPSLARFSQSVSSGTPNCCGTVQGPYVCRKAPALRNESAMY